MKNSFVLIPALFLFLLVTSPASSAEVTLLDQVCVLDNAGSAQFFLTFSSRYSGEQAVVRLINGSEPGVNTTRVSSADIWLNRQKLWGPSDFQGDISQLETTVNLAAGQNIDSAPRRQPRDFNQYRGSWISTGPWCALYA